MSAIRSFERELSIRGLVAALNDASHRRSDLASVGPFLHPDAVYRPSLRHHAEGRNEVVRVCGEMRDAFVRFELEIVAVIVSEEVSIVEHTAWVQLEGSAALRVMGFSSFRFDGNLISEWHQVHT